MKLLSFLAIAASLLTCQTKTNESLSPQDREKIKGDIEVIVDRIIQSYNAKEINAVFLDYKNFTYGITGRILDYRQFNKTYMDFFESVKTQSYTKVKGDLSYADPDIAIYYFVTAYKIEKKNGETMSNDGYSTTLIFKRIQGEWRVIAGHES